MWPKPPHEISIPYVNNAMSRDEFEFIWRNIHFSEISDINNKGVRGYDPLLNFSYPLEKFMKGMRGLWTARKHVTIEKSMIKYMGKSVTYVQYIPANPIKHGIKVFAMCCAFSEILIGFKVHFVQGGDSDDTALGISDDLVKEDGLTSARVRTLYTNNYYTPMEIAKHMLNEYGWTIVGTILPTDNKSRADHDITFLEFLNEERNGFQRGWNHWAEIELRTTTSKAYYIQCTTWRYNK